MQPQGDWGDHWFARASSQAGECTKCTSLMNAWYIISYHVCEEGSITLGPCRAHSLGEMVNRGPGTAGQPKTNSLPMQPTVVHLSGVQPRP